MGQGGGIARIPREARDEAERLGREPGACAARETCFLFGRLAAGWMGRLPGLEVAPVEGSGIGLSVPCGRADCEWSSEGLRVPSPGAYPVGRVCPRWVRVVEAANAKLETATSNQSKD